MSGLDKAHLAIYIGMPVLSVLAWTAIEIAGRMSKTGRWQEIADILRWRMFTLSVVFLIISVLQYKIRFPSL